MKKKNVCWIVEDMGLAQVFSDRKQAIEYCEMFGLDVGLIVRKEG